MEKTLKKLLLSGAHVSFIWHVAKAPLHGVNMSNEPNKVDVLILGAGLSGLAAAFRLQVWSPGFKNF